MRAKLGIALLTMLLLAAGCGDDGGDDGGDSSGGEGDGEARAALDVDAILALDGTECEEPEGDPLLIGYAADFSELGGYADGPGSEAAQFMADRINCAGGTGWTPTSPTTSRSALRTRSSRPSTA